MGRPTWALVAALACITHAPARADTGDELAQIRRQLQEMKRNYEVRIEALEKRLAGAEARAGSAAQQSDAAVRKADEAVQQAGAAQASASAQARQQRGNAFNPGISLVLQGRYAGLKQDPETYRIGGFIPSGGEVDPGKRGLSLAESELVFTANADPWFSGALTGALAPDGGFEVENAYVQTLGLGHGLTLKAGRFFSKLGYLNEQHQHAWDFIDAPLPYRAFLGGQLADDGVQLKWVAPTTLLVEVGAEAGRGLSFPGSDRSKNGVALGTLFGHVGGDIGTSHSWRIGLSHVRTSPQGRAYDDLDSAGTGVTNAFSGRSRLWVADAVWKWAPNGNPHSRNLKLQAEYFQRREDGRLTFDTEGAAAGPLADRYRSRQSGWTTQAVYQFMPKWRVGLRLDRLDPGSVDIGQVQSGALAAADFPILQSYRPSLRTLMIDWSPSEFSRLRLQFAQDRSRPDRTDNQIFLQYIMSLGTHRAHSW